MKVVLLPLDERPATVRDPRLVAAVAGAEVVTPPEALLPAFRVPGDRDGLADWLRSAAADADGVVASVDLLCHGGLVPSRLGTEPPWAAAARLAVLPELRAQRPDLPLVAFATIARTPDADLAEEEPAYWARHGRSLHRLSALLDRAAAGEAVDAEVAAARAALPPGVVGDWLGRRLRTHQVALAAVGLVADRTLDLLVLCSDDTAVHAVAGAERRWLGTWAGWLDLRDRVLVYPGADEVAGVLVARLLAARAARPPRVAVRCAVDAGLDRVAPYEDAPVGSAARRQVAAAGATVVDSDPDLLLVVHPPSTAPGDWAVGPRPQPGPQDAAAVEGLTALLDEAAAAGVPVALADCAWPNGADPGVVALLQRRRVGSAPLTYAGWNTAGNTIGGALAPAVAALAAGPAADRAALRRLLVARLVEDAGYMTAIRPRLRTSAAPEIEAALGDWLARLGPFGAGYRIAPGSVRLPWDRTFELDLKIVETVAVAG